VPDSIWPVTMRVYRKEGRWVCSSSGQIHTCTRSVTPSLTVRDLTDHPPRAKQHTEIPRCCGLAVSSRGATLSIRGATRKPCAGAASLRHIPGCARTRNEVGAAAPQRDPHQTALFSSAGRRGLRRQPRAR